MIYLDNAASTKPYPQVVEVLAQASQDYFANPSSIHSLGSQARVRLDEAREAIATRLGCQINEIYFSSGATEANNWVLRGCQRDIITTKVEHMASLATARDLEGQRRVDYIGVDRDGLIDLRDLEALPEGDRLLSIIYANNETGVLQDLGPIIAIARDKGWLIHLDAVQALGKVPINLASLDVDFVSLSSHKIHGPKGLGILYIKEGRRLDRMITGGGQELGLRAGTENLPAVLAFAKALDLILEGAALKNAGIGELKDYMEEQVVTRIPGVNINGRKAKRVSNISSLSFADIDSTMLLMMLDRKGFCVSAGSACTAGSVERSHVIEAMGLEDNYIAGTIRVSLSYETSHEDIDKFLESLSSIVRRIRA